MTDAQTNKAEGTITSPEQLLKMVVDGHYSYYADVDPEQENLPMLWIVDDKGKVQLVVTVFRDETEKRMFCEIMAPKALELLGADMYAFTSESWLSVNPLMEDDGSLVPKVMPSKDPNRKEIIVTMVVTKQNGVVASSMLEILRDPFTKKISLAPFDVDMDPTQMAGRMSELFTGGKAA